MSGDPEKPGDEPVGPAARARAEGREYNIQIVRHAMTPLCHEDGTSRSKLPAPYLPVLRTCDLCPARCCRLNVKISLPDAIRYCTTLGLPFFAGLMMVPSPHAAHAFRIERDPVLNPDPEGWIGTAEIQLRRQNDGSCHALVTINGYERCGVYGARPSMCRLYPMSWTSDVAKGSPGMVLCPVPYAVVPEAEQQFLRDINQSIDDWEVHDDVVIEWHAREVEERTARSFLAFALPRTAEKLGKDPRPIVELMLAPGLAYERLHQQMIKAGVVKPR